MLKLEWCLEMVFSVKTLDRIVWNWANGCSGFSEWWIFHSPSWSERDTSYFCLINLQLLCCFWQLMNDDPFKIFCKQRTKNSQRFYLITWNFLPLSLRLPRFLGLKMLHHTHAVQQAWYHIILSDHLGCYGNITSPLSQEIENKM